MKKPFYITTPIYYPSGSWHLGHSYTTVCCDAIARYKRLCGFDVYYLTGTDEHGQKIQERAKSKGKSPKVFVDEITDSLKQLWNILDISYDGFIRTTDESHKNAVAKIFSALVESGDIYKSKYKGQYCTPCESFWTSSQSKDGLCPDCKRPTTYSEEECYFFRLSKYKEPLLKLLTETDFLQPKSRVKEMVNNFLKDNLEDLAVSRSNFSWGIPVPEDPESVIYVWVDALTNYITALGYQSDDDSLFKKYWPCDIHMMAKEIVRFHSIIWPAILMALKLPLPKKVYGHGWLLFDGDKMSKSKGNIVDPFVLVKRYSKDAIRYTLLREISFGQDCQYSTENFLNRINSDLCNDLGNLVKRTISMAMQYFQGKIERPSVGTEYDAALSLAVNKLNKKVSDKMDALEISKAIEKIFEVVSFSNKYIDLTKPWVLFKEQQTEKLEAVLYNLLEAIRVAATMLLPFIPSTCEKIFSYLGKKAPANFSRAKFSVEKSYSVKDAQILFARLDIKKELAELEQLASPINANENGAAG